SYDTVDISSDGRRALEYEMLESFRAGKGIKSVGTLTSVSSLNFFEDFEKAVSAEKRDKAASNNFDRHVDQMVSAYRQMRSKIEEKYANMSQKQQERSYFIADDKSIQPLTKETELELLDKAYEQHSEAMAYFTESLSDLQDFKPQIIYHRSGESVIGQSNHQIQSVSADNMKKKKGEIKAQAYQVFMSAINKGNFQSNSGSSVSSRSELNRIWDYYAN
ncbi:MAG: hypothetical protein K2H91_07300, partial [Lachnospiraceae bacterium]|nr:hypothetical protein [Lachnospiraceae bacterium]